MRATLFPIVFSIVVALVAPVSAASSADSTALSSVSVAELQAAQPAKDGSVATDASRGGAAAWYRSWLSITFGVLVGVIVVVAIAFAIWGGGTTIGDAGYADRIRSLEQDERLWEPEPRDKDQEPTLASRILVRMRRSRHRPRTFE